MRSTPAAPVPSSASALSATPPVSASFPLAEPESLDQLLGDCRRMAAHWHTPAAKAQAVVAPASLRGIVVPPASAHVVRGMAEFGD
ncbi:hypothetical protein [Streptomyces sp. NPDC088910]|uniref:hypothetical protein n=1 Tax=Streptomyces sp. NPDC088910 TaxID=3365911 RepID=UPI0037F13F2C